VAEDITFGHYLTSPPGQPDGQPFRWWLELIFRIL